MTEADCGPETVRVPLGDRAYEVRIGRGLTDRVGAEVRPFLRRSRVAVVTDVTVAALHLDRLVAGLGMAGFSADVLTLPEGEKTKSWKGLERVVEWLIEREVARDDTVIAFGGGVIGDLTGFAAAILRRGVGYVQLPTTLLAQVDSSVGGKTAINSPLGKNLIGAFHQPRLVLADIDLLASLPERDFRAGYGEVAKYGLLGDAEFFDWLEANASSLGKRDAAALTRAVKRSCEMKAAIVAADETEQGERALLNLGHTFCHALEAATDYSDRLLHGEGVAVGCLLAFELSSALGLCAQETPSRVAAHFDAMGLRSRIVQIPGELPDARALIALMGQDKKVRDGRLAFVLAHDIGSAFVARDVNLAVVERVLEAALTGR